MERTLLLVLRHMMVSRAFPLHLEDPGGDS